MIFYDIINRWLLLSPLLICFNNFTSLTTYKFLGTLTDNLGCFPFDIRPYHLMSDYYK